MDSIQFFGGKVQPINVHRELVQATWDCLKNRRCAGATTGMIMEWIKAHRKELLPALNDRAPKDAGPTERTQHFKTLIGHALDELQNDGQVHCDEIGKRMMHGDERSAPVWRTADDYLALRDHLAWALREKRPNSTTWYSKNHLKVAKNPVNPDPNWVTTYTMTADAVQWGRRDTTWISKVHSFFSPKNNTDQ